MSFSAQSRSAFKEIEDTQKKYTTAFTLSMYGIEETISSDENHGLVDALRQVLLHVLYGIYTEDHIQFLMEIFRNYGLMGNVVRHMLERQDEESIKKVFLLHATLIKSRIKPVNKCR